MAFKSTKKLWQTTAIAGVVALTPILGEQSVLANPLGGVVSSGSAVINTSGPVTTINQTTGQVLIDWDSFNIGAGETTQFIQPTSQSIAVNRIHDANPSVINGSLTANGQIVLINQNGMVFGAGSQVDVGSLVVSTADISDDTRLSMGILDLDLAGSPGVSIVNNGIITVSEAGLAAFVAPHISNSGIIQASLGKIHLGAGDVATVDLYGDGLVDLAITDEDINKSILNSGTISASGGEVLLTAKAAKGIVESVINMDGVVSASYVSQEGGKIVLSASDINLSGIVEANGATGGGEILIGGDYQGVGDVETADTTTVTADAQINARATDSGEGGRVIVWADDTTYFNGDIDATGVEGDGFVETSGKQILTVGSQASVLADQWLLDPTNVSITNGSGDDVSGGGSFDPASGTVDADTITAALNAGTSVTITTNAAGPDEGNIGVSSATINKTSGGDATLTLQANNSISVSNSSITSSSGALNLTLHADSDNSGAGSIHSSGSTITTNGGNFIAGGGIDPLTGYATGTSSNRYGIYFRNGTSINTGSGDISLRGMGELGGTNSQNYGILFINGTVLETTTGDISLNGFGGNNSTSNYGIYLNSYGGDTERILTETGAITLTGTGGSNVASGHYGMRLIGAEIASTVSSPTAGAITINGTAGANTTASGIGVYLTSSALDISSVSGDINIIGQGVGNSSAGIRVQDGTISSIGTGVDAATITFDGTGGAIDDDNHGVLFDDSDIQTIDGDIDITGLGGNGTSDSNYGLSMHSNATISSTGTGANAGNIFIDATGGNGTSSNHGFYAATSSINTVDGNINIDGTGGNGSAGANVGFYLFGGASINSTGIGANAGTVTINAIGGNAAGNNNYGFYARSTGSDVISVDGDITINGTGVVGTGGNNHGFYLYGGKIISTGTGADSATIDITAITPNGRGFYMLNSESQINTDDGNITLTGNSGTSYDFILFNGTSINASGDADITFHSLGATPSNSFYTDNTTNLIGGATATGDITLNIDGEQFRNSVQFQTSGDVYITPRTDSTTIGLGDGTGTLRIDTTDLANVFVGINNLIIGSATGTGAVDIDNASVLSGVEVLGGTMVVDTGDLTAQGDIALRAKDDLTINGDITATTGSSILLQSEDSIIASGTTITSGGGAVDVTVHSDSDNNDNGAISLTDTTITTNGGDFIAGGGVNPLTDFAYGVSGNINGVDLDGTSINAGVGDISIRGNGRLGAGSNFYGIRFSNSSSLNTTTGDIELTGVGGNGSQRNYGIYGNASDITTQQGAITLTGDGGTSSSDDNHGVFLTNVGITSTSASALAGDVRVVGTAGLNNVDRGYGVIFTGNTDIMSESGDIYLTGTGIGSGTGQSHGVYMSGGSDIISTGSDVEAANIIITGTGGNVAADDHGINITNTSVTATHGDITFDGNSDTSTSIYLNNTDVTNQNANISIDGLGGGTEDAIFLTGGSRVRTTAGGDLTIIGQAQGTGSDIELDTGSQELGTATMTGDITLTMDTFTSGVGNNIETQGDVTLLTRTAGRSIGLGAGAGDLSITNAELGQIISGGKLTIGNIGATGAVDIDSVDISAGGYDIDIHGGNFVLNGTGLTTNGETVFNIGGTLVNNAGAGALDAGTGRWLVYLASPDNLTANGLAADQTLYEQTFALNPPASIAGTDNTFLFASTEVLSSLPETVETPTPTPPSQGASDSEVNVIIEGEVNTDVENETEINQNSENSDTQENEIEEATTEEKENKIKREASCLLRIEGEGCILSKVDYKETKMSMIDKINSFVRRWAKK